MNYGANQPPCPTGGDAHVAETTCPAGRGPSTGWGILARHGTSKAGKKLDKPGETPRTLASYRYGIKTHNTTNNYLKNTFFSLNRSRISHKIQ
jgi:hypothetical protein